MRSCSCHTCHQQLGELQDEKLRLAEQESILLKQLQTLKSALTESHEAHDTTKSHVFDLTAKVGTTACLFAVRKFGGKTLRSSCNSHRYTTVSVS